LFDLLNGYPELRISDNTNFNVAPGRELEILNLPYLKQCLFRSDIRFFMPGREMSREVNVLDFDVQNTFQEHLTVLYG